VGWGEGGLIFYLGCRTADGRRVGTPHNLSTSISSLRAFRCEGDDGWYQSSSRAYYYEVQRDISFLLCGPDMGQFLSWLLSADRLDRDSSDDSPSTHEILLSLIVQLPCSFP